LSNLSAEPIVEEAYFFPSKPLPMSTVIFTTGINNSSFIEDVRLIVEECSESINYLDRLNLSLDYSYSCCKDFYQIEFNLTHEDAAHIRYYILINDNNSWYQSETWVTNLTINNNGNCYCVQDYNKTPGFEFISMILSLIILSIYLLYKKM
jgi:hypothetical protein